MRIIQLKYRVGNLALDKYGIEVDNERAILPTLIYAGRNSGHDHITVFGIGWWKWGARVVIHWRTKHVSR